MGVSLPSTWHRAVGLPAGGVGGPLLSRSYLDITEEEGGMTPVRGRTEPRSGLPCVSSPKKRDVYLSDFTSVLWEGQQLLGSSCGPRGSVQVYKHRCAHAHSCITYLVGGCPQLTRGGLCRAAHTVVLPSSTAVASHPTASVGASPLGSVTRTNLGHVALTQVLKSLIHLWKGSCSFYRLFPDCPV